MKLLCTSDWHLGNLFHGNDRLPEHKHFITWLLEQIRAQQPDALLVAGDVYDNGSPSAATQSVFYAFLAEATEACSDMTIIITAGNHDSASRIEAPRELLCRHKIEVRGNVRRKWVSGDEGSHWENDYDDLLIPIDNPEGGAPLVVAAVPYLRSDISSNGNYSQGVNTFLHTLTSRARELYPASPIVMMAHLYAKGAEVAENGASEKITIGGQEEVTLDEWEQHPEYFTCGHIHKRQKIWGTDWARYTGSVLPMSFAEVEYHHGVDLISLEAGSVPEVQFLEYSPQHPLKIIGIDIQGLSGKKLDTLLQNSIDQALRPRNDDNNRTENYDYVEVDLTMDKVDNDLIKRLEAMVEAKDAVLCKIQKIMPSIELHTLSDEATLRSIDDVVKRDPLQTLQETFASKHNRVLNERQAAMLRELIDNIQTETND